MDEWNFDWSAADEDQLVDPPLSLDERRLLSQGVWIWGSGWSDEWTLGKLRSIQRLLAGLRAPRALSVIETRAALQKVD